MDNQRIFLLDAMSFIYRAYHAMSGRPPMSTKAGLPTGCVYIFNNMLQKLRNDFSPQYLVACCDVKGPTWHDKVSSTMPPLRKQDKEGVIEEIPYLGYKANRHFGEVDDFLVQIPYIYRLLDAHGIPVVKLEGWEADDLIGTLVKRVHTEEPERIVFIVSSDKDMMQLVDEHTRVLNVAKDNLICDVEKVKALVGVPPCRIIDVMALRGDSSDNVPGAPGIGDKGSVELVLQFGSVEDVIECASQIFKKTYRVTLELNKDAVLVSKHLVTIDCNAPLTLNIADMKIRPVNKEALSALYEELEFKSIPGARNQEAVHPEEKLMSLNLFEEL